MIVRFGPAFDWEACAARGSIDYYDQLDESDEWSYLRFDKVPYARYEATPSDAPRADIHCKHCGASFEYLLGADTRLKSDIGLPLAEAPAPSKSDGELLLGAACRECGAEVAAWMAARWDGNLIVSLRPLGNYPSRRAKYFYQWPVLKQLPKQLAGMKAADVMLANNPCCASTTRASNRLLRWTGKEPVTGKRVLIALTSAGKIYGRDASMPRRERGAAVVFGRRAAPKELRGHRRETSLSGAACLRQALPMEHTDPTACLGIGLLRHVRDAQPTVAEFVAWLGPRDAGKYHVLRKAGLLLEQNGRVILSPDHCTADARGFRFEAQLFLLDEDRIMIFQTRSPPP